MNENLPALTGRGVRKTFEAENAPVRALRRADLTATAAAPGVPPGGQRQRLAIARALANEPTLLLADEPTGALDSDGGQEVIELLTRLHSGGQTIVLVTHDAQVAAAAQRIVRMLDGRILPAEPGTEPRRGASLPVEAV